MHQELINCYIEIKLVLFWNAYSLMKTQSILYPVPNKKIWSVPQDPQSSRSHWMSRSLMISKLFISSPSLCSVTASLSCQVLAIFYHFSTLSHYPRLFSASRSPHSWSRIPLCWLALSFCIESCWGIWVCLWSPTRNQGTRVQIALDDRYST